MPGTGRRLIWANKALRLYNCSSPMHCQKNPNPYTLAVPNGIQSPVHPGRVPNVPSRTGTGTGTFYTQLLVRCAISLSLSLGADLWMPHMCLQPKGWITYLPGLTAISKMPAKSSLAQRISRACLCSITACTSKYRVMCNRLPWGHVIN